MLLSLFLLVFLFILSLLKPPLPQFPELLYFEQTPELSQQHQLLPVYFSNICLRLVLHDFYFILIFLFFLFFTFSFFSTSFFLSPPPPFFYQIHSSLGPPCVSPVGGSPGHQVSGSHHGALGGSLQVPRWGKLTLQEWGL